MRKDEPRQLFQVHCACGVRGSVHLAHYEIVRCKCGRRFWALRPKRDNPLLLFPHPE